VTRDRQNGPHHLVIGLGKLILSEYKLEWV
jgi:hypothetical protein